MVCVSGLKEKASVLWFGDQGNRVRATEERRKPNKKMKSALLSFHLDAPRLLKNAFLHPWPRTLQKPFERRKGRMTRKHIRKSDA